MYLARASLLLTSTLLLACSGSTPAADAPASSPNPPSTPAASSTPSPPAAPKEKEKEKPATGFPSACEKTGDLCLPDSKTADRLCKLPGSDGALVLFGKSTPWTRGYLTRDTEAWNATGGSTARGKLLFDEEVIVLRKRAAGGMVVGQGGGYDVMRWDGSCSSLAEEELTLKRPPKAKTAAVGWRDIGTATRDALTADPKLAGLYEKRRKECKGVTTGDVSAACVKADAALGAGIIEFVRAGGPLPTPKLPE